MSMHLVGVPAGPIYSGMKYVFALPYPKPFCRHKRSIRAFGVVDYYIRKGGKTSGSGRVGVGCKHIFRIDI